MGNLFTGIFNSFKFFFENPLWAIALVIGILLMPLEVLDIVLYIIVNILVLIINLFIFVLFTLFNILVTAVNILVTVIWSFLANFGMGGTAPVMPLLVFTPQPYVTVNLFSPDTNILIIILGVLGESLPFW
ncbi:MAG: hypothetical protein LN408_03225 [Candidatus Thermoplasmatota archaeon]|nr:hypothetical protein [Candidatus Thermoplasmatota archaeon]